MNFLNPIVLFGLVAAGIPLLLHLLNLRKLKTVDFSTLRFLQELQKTTIRKIKVQQILLLILRTLIIICAVLAFSRPLLTSRVPLLGSHVKSSVIIILDNSYSMDVGDEYGNRMKQAKNIAQSIVSALKDGDEIACITSADIGDKRRLAFTRNLPFMTETIQSIGIAPVRAGLHNLLRMSASLLSSATSINREVYIITDAQENVLSDAVDSTRSNFGTATLYVIPLAGKSLAGVNLSVDSVALLSQFFQPGKDVDVQTWIRNSSDKDVVSTTISMNFNDQRVSQVMLDIPAGETRSTTVKAPTNARGAIRGSISIDADIVEQDNKRYFGFVIPPEPNVICASDANDRQFLSIVLATAQEKSLARVRMLSGAELSGTNITSAQMAFLAEGSLRQSDIPRLKNYVENGGGLMVFASAADNIQTLATFLRQCNLGESVESTYPPNQPARFTSTDKLHPLFQGVFAGSTQANSVVESPAIERAVPCTGGQSIIGMNGGNFLAESRIGKGRILYCAVSPSAVWSSFPLTGMFPATIIRSIAYCTVREASAKSILAGQLCSLPLPSTLSATSYQLTDPQKTQTRIEAAVLPSGSIINLGILKESGVYTVSLPTGEAIAAVAVNPPADEGALRFVDGDNIVKGIRQHCQEGVKIDQIQRDAKIGESVARARTGTELWKLFVILAVVFALTEMIVARIAQTTPSTSAA